MENRAKQRSIFLYILGVVLLGLMAYGQSRSNHLSFGLNIIFLYLIYLLGLQRQDFSIRTLFYAAIVIRLALLPALPQWSEDIYRFVWDGRMLSAGMDPFVNTPTDVLYNREMAEKVNYDGLIDKLNSPEYFTVYPPLSQVIFAIAASLFDNLYYQIISLKTLLFLGETFLLWFFIRMYKLKPLPFALYAFNPLVLLEVSANAHFEGLVLAFMIPALYYWDKRKFTLSALFLSAAIATKLLPILALPLSIKKPGGWRSLIIPMITVVFTFCAFAILINVRGLEGFVQSLGMYFRKFEFNASLYFLLRELGFAWKGYNLIGVLAPAMAVLAALLMLLYVLFSYKKSFALSEGLLVMLSIHFCLATTIHPWYIILLLGLNYRRMYLFPVLWSFSILFSYFGYKPEGYEHPYMWIALEYSILYPIMLYELIKRKSLLPWLLGIRWKKLIRREGRAT